MKRALEGVRVFDLTRILAGPTCTQLLGDLGADVIKVEMPGAGDDTRKWGPPYLRDEAGGETNESAYYLASNRSKRSVAIDIARPEGQELARALIARSDLLVQNFKAGGLKKYGLDYESLKEPFPGLVYCSISGFGKTGPYASRAGYDYLAQGYGGLMSITGLPGGEPLKVGVGIADIMCGMYATVAVLAALRHRERTGEGQEIDLSLLDTQVAWLANEGVNYLLSGIVPQRLGNEHPNIVPYKRFDTADGQVVLAAGNDAQFRRWCRFAGVEALAVDPRFASNPLRVRNRTELYAAMIPPFRTKTTAEWVDGLSALGVPCGPVNDIAQVFEDEQVEARGMKIELPHHQAGRQARGEDGTVPLLANPIRMTATPPAYGRPPPTLGQHTDEVLHELLQLDEPELARLREEGVIG
ncbi:MAG: CoA transferase [Geminicoccaceae bacterium]|nr:CoA transferase [Geminicoccaceae bacterium]